MNDPYRFAESLNSETLDYVAEQKEKFTKKFGQISDDLREKMAGFVSEKKVYQAVVKGQHILTMYSEGENYHAALDDRVLYSTSNVITWVELSEDGRRVAVFETVGSDRGFLKLYRDSELVKVIEDKISQIVFTPASYYLLKTFSETAPPDGGELNSHRVLKDGKIVFGTGLKSTEFINMHPSGNRIIITVGDWNRSALFTGDLEDPSTWKKELELNSPVIPLGFVNGEICYLEKRGNGVIMVGERTVLESETPIEDCAIVENGFLALTLTDAKVHPALFGFDGLLKEDYELSVPMGFVCLSSDENSAVAVFESFGIPYSLYVYRNERFSRKEENKVLNISITENWANSGGVPIHYFLAAPGTGSQKQVLINGYGGYNISWLPVFSPLFAAILAGGISIVRANLRGGGEYGEEWHRAGIRENKQNVFNDFMAVIRQLRDDGYCIVVSGQSNGGLLVGSVLTQQPELIDGAVIGVPVLDMLRFHLLSVGKYWTTEYGDPDSPEDAKFLSAYSPYHNITQKEYPPVMIFSRLKDDRVHPAHAIKFHMRISEFTDGAYLRINPGGGHAGVPQKQRIQELCEEYNFITKSIQL